MQVTPTIVTGAILFTLACTADGAIQQAAEEASRLAILVHHQPDGRDLSDRLQPLLEAEASMQWAGQLVERAELNRLLEELKISASGLIDPNQGLQMGKMLHCDALLTVGARTDAVVAMLSLFPSAAVIYDRTYTERLAPQSLAMNIMADAVGAILRHNREPNTPQVSIGTSNGLYCREAGAASRDDWE
jgi:hypothetical protein